MGLTFLIGSELCEVLCNLNEENFGRKRFGEEKPDKQIVKADRKKLNRKGNEKVQYQVVIHYVKENSISSLQS